jgi:hypothetical protein
LAFSFFFYNLSKSFCTRKIVSDNNEIASLPCSKCRIRPLSPSHAHYFT